MVPFLLPTALVVFVLITAALLLFLRGYQVARPGTALIVTRPNSEPRVLFEGGAFSLPRHAELLDMTPRTLRIPFLGAGALQCSDGPVDATLTIRLTPNLSASDVLGIARSLGTAVANDPQQLGRWLEPQLRQVAQRCAARLGCSALADGSLALALRGELGEPVPGFSVEACDLAPGA